MSVTILQINQLNQAEFIRVVAPVFDDSPWVATAAWAKRPFADVEQLIAVLGEIVTAAGEVEKVGLIRAHSNLVSRVIRKSRLTADAGREAESAEVQAFSANEIEQLQKLTADYRYKFGFPFVTSHGVPEKAELLASFEQRLHHSRNQEIEIAVAELCRVASQRLRAMTPHRMTAARLTTQVLDLVGGQPAAEMQIELWAAKDGQRVLVATQKTNGEGRTETPLLAAGELKSVEYELVYFVGEYFSSRTAAGPGPHFLNRVPVRFFVQDADANYHILFTCTPWGYSAGRG